MGFLSEINGGFLPLRRKRRKDGVLYIICGLCLSLNVSVSLLVLPLAPLWRSAKPYQILTSRKEVAIVAFHKIRIRYDRVVMLADLLIGKRERRAVRRILRLLYKIRIDRRGRPIPSLLLRFISVTDIKSDTCDLNRLVEDAFLFLFHANSSINTKNPAK